METFFCHNCRFHKTTEGRARRDGTNFVCASCKEKIAKRIATTTDSQKRSRFKSATKKYLKGEVPGMPRVD